jgi:hypothetical protein
MNPFSSVSSSSPRSGYEYKEVIFAHKEISA